MSELLLDAQGLVKRYGGVVATDQVSLQLARGEVTGVIGPNGAGKSTLIGLLGGALVPNEGRIVFNGVDITALPAAERARLGIGRTYQIPRPFLDMTVRENLLAARFSLHPFDSGATARAACDAILERCGLADAAHWRGRDLPLLRRKRLEVARALALRPKLLLLDEVGAGLIDAEVTELIALVQSLRGEVDGVIIIEHVLRVVRECCDRLLVINFGKKFAEGPTAQVLASDEVAAVYLGTAHGTRPGGCRAGHGRSGAPPRPALAQWGASMGWWRRPGPRRAAQAARRAGTAGRARRLWPGAGAQRHRPARATGPGRGHPGHQRGGQDHAGAAWSVAPSGPRPVKCGWTASTSPACRRTALPAWAWRIAWKAAASLRR